MSHFHPKSAVLLFALALLGACASPGGRLQQAGSTAEVFDMRLDSDLAWARIKSPRQELWTIDGPGLNGLTIYNDIKPGEHVFQLGRERKSNPNGPWFRPGMRPDELRDVILDAVRAQGWAQVSDENFRPHDFGSVSGIRFEVRQASPEGLIYRGSVAAVERGGKLDVLYWKAPAEYYAPRDAAAVARMLDGLRYVR